MARIQEFLFQTVLHVIGLLHTTHFNPIVNEVMTNISLPAEAIYWQELGDSRILTV